MFGLRFTRPTGAAADVQELAYIIALHQTSIETRSNATVSSHDIRAILQSRYSLQISHAQALKVVRALGGGNASNQEAEKVEAYAEQLQDSSEDPVSPQTTNNNTNNQDPAVASDSEHHHHYPWDGIVQTVVHGMTHPLSFVQTNKEEHGNAAAGASTSNKPSSISPPQVETVAENSNKLSVVSKASVQATLSMLQKVHSHSPQLHPSHDIMAASSLSQQRQQSTSSPTHSAMSVVLQEKVKADLRQQLTFQHTQQAAVRQLHTSSSTTTTNNEKQDDDDEEQIVFEHPNNTDNITDDPSPKNTGPTTPQPVTKQGGPLAPEFLDLVQILCTLLIPTLSRICHHAKLQMIDEQDESHKDENGASERVGTKDEAPAESPIQKVQQWQKTIEKYIPCSKKVWLMIHGTISKLVMRIYRLCRSKLQIVDDNTHAFLSALSERQLLQIGHRALLKDLPLDAPPLVDEALVQYLLISHGEVERANNLPLVRAMVDMAQTPGGAMDERGLIQALTQDLGAWDPLADQTPKTFFADVFPGERLPSRTTQLEATNNNTNDKHNKNLDNSSGSESEYFDSKVGNVEDVDADASPTVKHDKSSPTNTLNDELDEMESNSTVKPRRGLFCCCQKKNEFTYFSGKQSAYDMVIDSYSSLLVTVFIWVFYFMNVAVYGAPIISYAASVDFGPDFWHKILETVFSWAVIAIVLSGFGLVFMIPLSSGNKPSRRSVFWQVIAALFASLYSLGPYVGLRVYNFYANGEADIEQWETQANEEQITLFTGFIIVGLCITQIFFIMTGWIFPKMAEPNQNLWQPFKALTGFTFAHNEASVYSASTKKTEKLLANAIKMHVINDNLAVKTASQYKAKALSSSNQDQVHRNFVLHGEESEQVGGIVWTWWRFFDGWVSNDEGIWISTRLVITQIGQMISGAILLLALYRVTDIMADASDEERTRLEEEGYPESIIRIYPTGTMIRSAFYPGCIVAGFISLFLIILMFPSSVASILKYRSGIKPSLGSPYFELYRNAVDSTYMNTTNAIYGLAGSAGLCYLAVGLILLLFYWPVTQSWAISLSAWCIGLGITVGLKMLMTMTCRKIQFRNFFRIRPNAANLSSLALECWFIGIGTSVLLARVGQFLFAALFWVGRIDVPFLSEDVNLMGYAFDYVPHHYQKDLLVHEAHRHPYIERLNSMYLMKLRHGDAFVSEAGSAWRQLFLLAVFPWLKKYRVFGKEREYDAMIEAQNTEERDREERQVYVGGVRKRVKLVGKGIGDQVLDAGREVMGAGTDVLQEATAPVVETVEELPIPGPGGKPKESTMHPSGESSWFSDFGGRNKRETAVHPSSLSSIPSTIHEA